MKRNFLRIGLGLFGLILIISVGFVVWASNAAGPGGTAQAALRSDSNVVVEEWAGGYSFRPEGVQPDTGFIFYPGGRVDYRSYAPALSQVAAAGYQVVLVRVPLNLAVFNSNAAASAAAAFPQVARWAVGGHSLGGAMSATYAYSNLEEVDGLVLWASYPAGNNDLSSANIPVVSIYGTQDGVAAQERVLAASELLPANTRWVAIEGGNHAQFGDYGIQSGDGQPGIPAAAQWEQAARATIELLEAMGRE